MLILGLSVASFVIAVAAVVLAVLAVLLLWAVFRPASKPVSDVAPSREFTICVADMPQDPAVKSSSWLSRWLPRQKVFQREVNERSSIPGVVDAGLVKLGLFYKKEGKDFDFYKSIFREIFKNEIVASSHRVALKRFYLNKKEKGFSRIQLSDQDSVLAMVSRLYQPTNSKLQPWVTMLFCKLDKNLLNDNRPRFRLSLQLMHLRTQPQPQLTDDRIRILNPAGPRYCSSQDNHDVSIQSGYLQDPAAVSRYAEAELELCSIEAANSRNCFLDLQNILQSKMPDIERYCYESGCSGEGKSLKAVFGELSSIFAERLYVLSRDLQASVQVEKMPSL